MIRASIPAIYNLGISEQEIPCLIGHQEVILHQKIASLALKEAGQYQSCGN
jgi:hypothetical protein